MKPTKLAVNGGGNSVGGGVVFMGNGFGLGGGGGGGAD